MKLPEWDDQFVRWDRYKQFHMGLDQRLCATENYCWPPFIIFDDGEVIWRSAASRHSIYLMAPKCRRLGSTRTVSSI
jgi:hypothetical protein